MLRWMTMPEPVDPLLSTLLSLPDDRRAAVERELIPVARAAALGEVAADVAHDVANPLFGAIGLVDLLLDNAAPDSDEAARLQMVKDTTLEMKEALQVLLDFARGSRSGDASLDESVRAAIELLRHGRGRALEIEERYGGPAAVPCSPGALVQAVLQLLLAARAAPLLVEVSGTTLRLSPAPAETLGTVVAARIVIDHGGRIARDADGLTVSWG